MNKTIYTEVEVDVDLADFNTSDLIEELESRGWTDPGITNSADILRSLYNKRRTGQDYESELDQLIWSGLGRII